MLATRRCTTRRGRRPRTRRSTARTRSQMTRKIRRVETSTAHSSDTSPLFPVSSVFALSLIANKKPAQDESSIQVEPPEKPQAKHEEEIPFPDVEHTEEIQQQQSGSSSSHGKRRRPRRREVGGHTRQGRAAGAKSKEREGRLNATMISKANPSRSRRIRSSSRGLERGRQSAARFRGGNKSFYEDLGAKVIWRRKGENK